MNGPETFLFGLVFDSATMIMFIVLFFLLPILPKDTKQLLFSIVLKPRMAAAIFK
jgi:hypothetical protein